MRATVVRLVVLLFWASAVLAQESPFVPREVFDLWNAELSGDRSFEHLRHLTLHHSPTGGSRGFQEKMRWILQKAREAGLDDVRLVDHLPYRGTAWTVQSAELWMLEPERRRLTSHADVPVAIANYSRSGTWEGELVDVGAGSSDADYEGKDVRGKIVLVSGSAAAAMREAVWERGALGVVYYNESRGLEYPDQVAYIGLNPNPPAGRQNTFAFSISYRMGLELKRRLARRTAPAAIPGAAGEGTLEGEKIVLRAEVDAEFHPEPKNWIVEGWIRGTKYRDQQIVLTAHAQEEKYSANDDNSGCANLLEIARAWTRLIREGRLPRPVRDVRFWWVNEFASEYAYFATYPEERRALLVNINQDMVGAKQSVGSRIQHITRLPHSRASFLETVVGSVAELVMRGNTAYLSAGQAGTPQPFSRPILALNGTRERYGAEIVPYFDNTDHHAFNDVIIGVPGVTLTNWPDELIHSNYDDLWQMDATQLERNAFIVAASANYLATLDTEGAPVLAAQVRSSALRVLSEAFARASELLATAPTAARPQAYQDGDNLIEQAGLRAARLLESVRVFADSALAEQLSEDAREAIGEAGYLRERFALQYRRLTGEAPPLVSPSQEEQAMAAKIPEIVGTPAEFLDKRSSIGNRGLHALMAFEVWCFVDGRRSYLDIYRAVRAEAQLAGEWYYGRVTARQVAELLDAGVQAGLLKLKP
ncbi:MAG: M28 family peptidase [Firmicutes bacterium]|nr:M28 family peptidase [Bacillota bacterium]